MSHSSISSNSSRRQAKIDGRSVGYCYSIERKFAEPVLSGLNAFSAAARSVACFSEDSGLSVEDYHSVVESLRTTWSTRNFKPTERPCFVLRVDEEEKTADVFLLATFGGKTANQLDQLTRRFVASVEPTPPQPHDDSITGKTIPTWKRIPQHIVLIRATVSHSDLVRNLSNRGTVLDNYVELSVEAALREQEFQNQDKELRAREWRSHQKRLWRLRQPRLPQSTSFSALGAIPEASAAAPVQQEFLPEYPGVDASAPVQSVPTQSPPSRTWTRSTSSLQPVVTPSSSQWRNALPRAAASISDSLSSERTDEKLPAKNNSRTQWANERQKRRRKFKREQQREGEGDEPAHAEPEPQEGFLVSAVRRLGLGKSKP